MFEAGSLISENRFCRTGRPSFVILPAFVMLKAFQDPVLRRPAA
jgi:hypothetical protein